MPREWDAIQYDKLPLPHVQWGLRTINRLDLVGNETVLDAGCGTGRDAAELLTRLDTGRVVAVDGSRQMLDRLRDRLAGRLDRIEVLRADLTEPLPIVGQVDAVLSVAVFHWIHDHDALFANLAAVLRPGGRMAIDCGGLGNIAGVAAAVSEVLGRPAQAQPSPWHFADPHETEKRLQTAGFNEIEVQLVPDPARFRDAGELRAYLRTGVLGAHLDRMPVQAHDDFVDAVAQLLPEPVVDYVRLQITCRR